MKMRNNRRLNWFIFRCSFLVEFNRPTILSMPLNWNSPVCVLTGPPFQSNNLQFTVNISIRILVCTGSSVKNSLFPLFWRNRFQLDGRPLINRIDSTFDHNNNEERNTRKSLHLYRASANNNTQVPLIHITSVRCCIKIVRKKTNYKSPINLYCDELEMKPDFYFLLQKPFG